MLDTRGVGRAMLYSKVMMSSDLGFVVSAKKLLNSSMAMDLTAVCYMFCFKNSVVTIVANSSFKLARAVAWISSAEKFCPSRPFLLKVAVASETRKVSNPKLPAILVVVDTQWSVVKPTITNFVIFKLSSCSFRSVPIKALFTFFLIIGSLSHWFNQVFEIISCICFMQQRIRIG